jgi:16S rRNA (guanine966-N2)-methyltransferase
MYDLCSAYQGESPAVASGRRNPRIIAGEAGGRRLAVPSGEHVRPTSDRVKESVFSALGPGRLVGARVLDLYAGSGALGLEALSRGAAGAVLVERDAAAARAIRANIETLGFSDRAVLRVGAVAAVLGGPGPGEEAFDLVLLDPPYDTPQADLEGVLRRIVEGGWVATSGTVVVERAAGSSDLGWPAGWGSTWERCYGDTLVLFAQRK